MYEKNGEKYFIVDSHIHFWDASPANWKPGAEQYAKGWIECFHAYMGLGPPETHWSLEKFQKYSEEDFVHDEFEEARRRRRHLPVDVPQGVVHERVQHARAQRRAGREAPGQADRQRPLRSSRGRGRAASSSRRTPSSTTSRASSSTRPSGTRARADGGSTTTRRQPFFDKCKELGIRNIHVHKGPTIWPLDKDAFDPRDVDKAATDNPELNFIVEHVGLPRIEDFCFMATQEPNVYAGLSVVLGGLMFARPRFFAKVMGELLFWVGEDKMLFGSDYGIWEPKMADRRPARLGLSRPTRSTPTTRGSDGNGKKKILGLNAAKLYGIDVPAELRLHDGAPAAKEDAQLVESA